MLPSLLLIVASPSAGQSLPTPEELIGNQQRQLRADLDQAACQRTQTGNEIVVCGRRTAERYRLPFAPEPEPGVRPDMTSARTALSLRGETCHPGPRRPSSPKLDLLAIAATVASLAATALKVRTPEPQPIKRC